MNNPFTNNLLPVDETSASLYLFRSLLNTPSFLLKVAGTTILGQYAPYTAFWDNQRKYNELMKTNPELCFDPMNLGNKPLYSISLSDNGTTVLDRDCDDNLIEINPLEATTTDILLNGYFPKPSMSAALKQEVDTYMNGVLMINYAYDIFPKLQRKIDRAHNNISDDLALSAARYPARPIDNAMKLKSKSPKRDFGQAESTHSMTLRSASTKPKPTGY